MGFDHIQNSIELIHCWRTHYDLHGTDNITDWGVKDLTGVNPHMVLVVGGTSEGPSTGGLRAVVWPLTSVCSDVNFADVGCGK